ncbi:flippase-like domain-containing protein [bacterium]|nr:flippase-like domain-containing protein [bacterium]
MNNFIKGKKLFWLKAIFFAVGGVVLTFFIRKLGVDKILNTIIDLKFYAIPLIINSFIWYLLYTSAWRNYFVNLKHQISFIHMLKIKICGESVNIMTPLNFMAGDPVRAYLLNHPLGHSTKFSSIIVDRLLHITATFSFVLVGILLTFTEEAVPPAVRWVLLAFYSVLLGLIGFVVYELVAGHGIRRIHKLLSFLRLTRRFPQLEDSLGLIGEELKSFAGGRKIYFLYAYIFHLLGRTLGAVEVAIIFHYLTGDTHFLLSVILATLTSVAFFVFSFIPGGIGIVESMYAGFFYYHKLDPALGVSMQLIRRLRALFWLGVGLVLMNLAKKPPSSEDLQRT